MRHLLVLLLALASPTAEALAAQTQPWYAACKSGYEGTGKCYMGREIAQVMGHPGAAWLDRPEREQEERPSVLIRNLGLAPGDVVADIGAGTGYFSLRIAPLVPKGRVLAVDIQPEMLDIIRGKQRDGGPRNVEPVLGAIDDPKLPTDSVAQILSDTAMLMTGTPLSISAFGVKQIQAALQQHGFKEVMPDGKWSEATSGALKKFQEAQKLEPTGSVNLRTLRALGFSNPLTQLDVPTSTPPAKPTK